MRIWSGDPCGRPLSLHDLPLPLKYLLIFCWFYCTIARHHLPCLRVNPLPVEPAAVLFDDTHRGRVLSVDGKHHSRKAELARFIESQSEHTCCITLASPRGAGVVADVAVVLLKGRRQVGAQADFAKQALLFICQPVGLL